MTLTTHAIVGAAVARVFAGNPLAAFCVAIASHFLIDALPHWDYHLRSAKRDEKNIMNNDMAINRDFFFDLLKIALDATAGLVLSFVIFQPEGDSAVIAVLLGVIGGILPDPLQFVYFKWRHEPLISIQRFHMWIHTDVKLSDQWISGPVMQGALVIACVAISLSLYGGSGNAVFSFNLIP